MMFSALFTVRWKRKIGKSENQIGKRGTKRATISHTTAVTKKDWWLQIATPYFSDRQYAVQDLDPGAEGKHFVQTQVPKQSHTSKFKFPYASISQHIFSPLIFHLIEYCISIMLCAFWLHHPIKSGKRLQMVEVSPSQEVPSSHSTGVSGAATHPSVSQH